MSQNRLISLWESGGTAFGLWCYLNNALAQEVVGSANADYLLDDLQHGEADFGQLVSMVRAADAVGADVIVRVPSCDVELIGKVLDLGIAGVMLPMVETEDQAKELVSAVRYPPAGRRSYGPIRSAVVRGHRTTDELAEVAVLAMIETQAGLENVEKIAQVEGLTGVYVGSVDLSLNLGIGPLMPSDHPTFQSAIERILTAAERSGLVCGLHCPDGKTAQQYAERGFRMLTAGTDSALLGASAALEIATAREVSS